MAKKNKAAKPKPQPKQKAQEHVAHPEKPSASMKLAEGRHKTAGEGVFLFDKTNYIIMGVGILLILLGFVIMATVPKVEMTDTSTPEEIFGFRAVVLPSFLVIIGLALQVVAILKKPKADTSNE